MLKRTPPQSPATNPSITLSGSAPNLNSMDLGNVTARNKRKREDDMISFMQEIKNLLQTSNAQSETKFLALQKSMSEIIAQNQELKNSITFVTKQYDDILIKIESIEKDRKVDRSLINKLEDKVESLEQILCLSKIEMRNIPKKVGESKIDLCNIVSETAKVLEYPVEKQEIKDIYRVNKKKGEPAIIVDFVSVTTKENILKKVRLFNSKKDKLNTSHINIAGETKPIYLSESLTMKGQRLFFLARKYANENGFKYCWTSHGKVFLRQNEGDQHLLIKSEAELKSISNQ